MPSSLPSPPPPPSRAARCPPRPSGQAAYERFSSLGGPGERRKPFANGLGCVGAGRGSGGEAGGGAAHDQLVRQLARLVTREVCIPCLDLGQNRLSGSLALTERELVDRGEPEEVAELVAVDPDD